MGRYPFVQNFWHALPVEAPRETAAFLDADLAILATPQHVYDEYAENIRAEYAHLDIEAYRSGRKAVLQSFLTRDELYFTSTGKALFEVAARANLAREIASL